MRLLVFLLAFTATIETARADVPASTAAVAPAPVPVAAPAPAPLPPDAAAKAAKQLAAGIVALQNIASAIGVPVPTALPPSFWDTTAGKVIEWTLYAIGVVSATVGTGISIYEAVR